EYRWMRALTPGVEFCGGGGNINNPEPTKEQKHCIFSVVKGELPHGLEDNFGAGVGLTSGSDHVVVKFKVELAKYICAIFGPSYTKAWLWKIFGAQPLIARRNSPRHNLEREDN